MRRHAFTLALILLLGLPGVGLAAENAWFGFDVSAETEGVNILNPTVRSLTIEGIDRDSPAAARGLQKGDQIIEVQGIRVAGSKASALEDAVPAKPGLPLHLKIRRGSTPPFAVTLIGVAEPGGG
ncbi:PDZ domain-containing protein [Chitinilyticum aquatile]|uniref:PDZ domain-containing protein n=1 Tax=Chitinilyticum aquatile TaxID=362520 RepID=UPI0004108630|nr:PDZ domain-containing protein [Chitinilyticum aquatile]